MAKKKIDDAESVVGLSVTAVRFSIKDKATTALFKKYFKEATVSGNLGKGIMKYEGHYSPDGAVFLGRNPKLDMNILSFNGQAGTVLLDKFRNDVLNLEENAHLAEKLSVSGVDSMLVTLKPDGVNLATDFRDQIENAVKIQQKTVPKLMIENGILYIGGKVGATSLQIRGIYSGDLSLKYIGSRFKLKDKSCDLFYQLLLKSVDASSATIVAYAIIQQLGRTNMTSLLDSIRLSIIKDYEVGKVVTYAQVKDRATTSSGKYIIRALSGIKNKLSKEDTASEAQTIFRTWFSGLNGDKAAIKNKAEFLGGLREISENFPVKSTKPGDSTKGGADGI